MRRNRNVTLDELRLALTRCKGNRTKSAKWLGVSFAWVMILIRRHEDDGEELPRTPHRKRHRLDPEEPEYEPTLAEIAEAKKLIRTTKGELL